MFRSMLRDIDSLLDAEAALAAEATPKYPNGGQDARATSELRELTEGGQMIGKKETDAQLGVDI